ncbi:MAG: hydroxyacylglutathione hydrolase, partial [Betaproteobacteria bacterium]
MNTSTIEPIPAFADNYIWLLTQGKRAAVVDPGDPAPVLDALRARHLQLAAILVTHHHGDHVGGVSALAAPGVPVYGPAGEDIPCRTHALVEGDAIDVLGTRFTVLDVPGHTRGHIAYYAAELDALFCGDTLFAAGCGRLFEGTPAQMLASLTKLAALPPATRVYCAHEYTLANLHFARAVEPDYAALALYKKAIWWSGREDFYAGPSDISELETAKWLDRRGGCLLLSSADYRFARGATSSFMTQRLGVASIAEDSGQGQ